MRKYLLSFPIFLFLLTHCSSTPPHSQSSQEFISNTLDGPQYCTLIYNEATKQTKIFGQESFCSKQTAALGSFQIPLALMSFDAGVLPNDQVKLSWDGLKRSHSQWNRDHTAASWMRFSVNWYGQRLAKLLGPEKMQNYLDKMNFGNKDLSGGLSTAWLVGPKESKITNTLKISAKESLQFWNEFWQENLELDKKSYSLTKKILSRISTPTFSGSKTWGQSTAGILEYDKNLKPSLVEGHFVGRIETKNGNFNFVTFLRGRMKEKSTEKSTDEPTELELTSQLAEELTWLELKNSTLPSIR